MERNFSTVYFQYLFRYFIYQNDKHNFYYAERIDQFYIQLNYFCLRLGNYVKLEIALVLRNKFSSSTS